MRFSSQSQKTNLWFYPNGSKKGSRFESYREAWWLLDPVLREISAEEPQEGTVAAFPSLRS